MNSRRDYDRCQAKSDVSSIHKRLDLGKQKIDNLNKEIMLNRKWDKLIFLMSGISLAVNLIR